MSKKDLELQKSKIPVLPEKAVKIEDGCKYLMVVDGVLTPQVFCAVQDNLDLRFGERVITLLPTDFDVKIYKINAG